MKNYVSHLSFVLLFSFLLGACGNNSVDPASSEVGYTTAADSSPARVVTVTGDADVRVVPDEVVVTLGVATEHRQLSQAQSKNDEIVQQVLALSREFAIDSNQVQTDFIHIEPLYEFPSAGSRDIEGYRVRKTIVVVLADISLFEDFLSRALDSGVNYVHDVEFRTTELRQYRDQARALAVQAAQEKAEALAGELGQNIGEPVMIQEEHNNWWSWYGYGWGGRAGGPAQNVVVEVAASASAETSSGIAPGQITVNAKVTVSFALQ